MSRLLIAWELGANYGHVARLLPIARKLRARGHQLFFAVRNTRVAAELLGSAGFPFTQAPFWHFQPQLARPPVNYAEMLLAEGHGDEAGLVGLVRSWRSLLRLFRPDLLIGDHSPTALIAVRVAGIPAIAIGPGFTIPPNQSPLPSIRPWEAISGERLREADARALRGINRVLRGFGAEPLGAVPELFGPTPGLLATFPELDPYGPREGGTYIGPIFSGGERHAVHWETEGRPRIFAYLRPDVPGGAALLGALTGVGAELACALPGIGESALGQFAGPHSRIYPHPIQADALIPTADLVVSYGGLGVVCRALLAGKPLLLAPGNVEQHLNGLRVERLGAGVSMGPERTEASFRAALTLLLESGPHRVAAGDFAQAHDGYQPDEAAERAVGMIEAALSAPGSQDTGNRG